MSPKRFRMSVHVNTVGQCSKIIIKSTNDIPMYRCELYNFLQSGERNFSLYGPFLMHSYYYVKWITPAIEITILTNCDRSLFSMKKYYVHTSTSPISATRVSGLNKVNHIEKATSQIWTWKNKKFAPHLTRIVINSNCLYFFAINQTQQHTPQVVKSK